MQANLENMSDNWSARRHYFSQCGSFIHVCTAPPLWSSLTIIAHFRRVWLSYMGTFQENISAAVSSLHLCCAGTMLSQSLSLQWDWGQRTWVVGILHVVRLVVHMVHLWCASDEEKHSSVLQFGIDPSILLVGSMPKQLMQPAIDYPVSCLAESHCDVTLFSQSQVCQMAPTSFLYVLSFYSACGYQ